MKKMRLILILSTLIVALLAELAFAWGGIKSCKSEFSTAESVSVQSTQQLCPPGSAPKLYIVKEKTAAPLIDERGNPQEINNTQFPCKAMWDSPAAGSYYIIVDCDGDSKYSGSEPFDNLTVKAVAGTASASRGEKDIGNHAWRYDSEQPALPNEMLQIKLAAEGESISLENITLRASGNGQDTEIARIEIYADENGNGKLETGETLIGSAEPAYSQDDGTTVIPAALTVEKGNAKNILIVYVMKENASEGEYILSVQSIYGKGASSGNIVGFSGLSLNSGVKKVLAKKTCLGELALELKPNPSEEGATVTAEMGNVNGCQNKTVVLRINPCGSSLRDSVCECKVAESGNGCSCSFKASQNRTYHACLDKNEDGDFIDFGEYALKDLIVTLKAQEQIPAAAETENLTGMNVTAEEAAENKSSITGKIISGIKEKIIGTSGVFILLEITLLVILLVLVLILLKLRRPAETKIKSSEAKE